MVQDLVATFQLGLVVYDDDPPVFLQGLRRLFHKIESSLSAQICWECKRERRQGSERPGLFSQEDQEAMCVGRVGVRGGTSMIMKGASG